MNLIRIVQLTTAAATACPRAVIFGWFLINVSLWLLLAPTSEAAEISLAWDPVEDDRVGLYEVHYGQQTGQYNASAQTTETRTQLASLEPATTYYIAVRACTADASLCSDFSNEISATTSAALTPEFSASPTTGVAPLTVRFSDASSGEVDSLDWDFGDGTTATGRFPSHTYQAAGSYDVTLTATGPGGEVSMTKAGVIVISEPPPLAAMSQSITSGTRPLSVTFTDESTGAIDSREWDLGDGATAIGRQVVHTYSTVGSYDVQLTVTGPGGSDRVLRTDAVMVEDPAIAPSADFSADTTAGAAPLAVQFSDTSRGDVTSWSWDFGDGTTSSAQHPSHSYQAPGQYSVSLAVAGPAGRDDLSRSGYITVSGGLAIEVGTLEVDDTGVWVELAEPFVEPVVIAKLTSARGADPVTVRVSDVTPAGFWVQLEEWDYLDGAHALEAVSFLAIERGVHELPDGGSLEADLVDIDETNAFASLALTAPFTEAPVILASVTTRNEADPVTVRLRHINPLGFELGLAEQEANPAAHAVETVAFVAIEPGSGTLGSWRYEAGRTADTVTHRDHALAYANAFSHAPTLFVDMQSTDDADTSTLRARGINGLGATIWVEEERSRDWWDTWHWSETAGYLAIE